MREALGLFNDRALKWADGGWRNSRRPKCITVSPLPTTIYLVTECQIVPILQSPEQVYQPASTSFLLFYRQAIASSNSIQGEPLVVWGLFVAVRTITCIFFQIFKSFKFSGAFSSDAYVETLLSKLFCLRGLPQVGFISSSPPSIHISFTPIYAIIIQNCIIYWHSYKSFNLLM